MSDAPERIWTWKNQLGNTFWREGIQMGQPVSAVEYVRADICREAALQYLSDTGQMMDRITALEARVAAADRLAEAVRAMEQAAAEMGFSGGRIGAALSAYLATKEPKA